MSTILSSVSPTLWTLADVQAHLDGFPLDRIRSYPSPGTATEQDLLDLLQSDDRICELIDGTLVEKTMAAYESMLAGLVIHFIHLYLDIHDLGGVFAPDALLRLFPGQVRAPDVSFIRWEKLPGANDPKPAIYAVAPDLAIEILSKSNTRKEMDRKLQDYFAAGTELVWYIDPPTRTARSYAAVEAWIDIGPDGSLSGGDVLPGFELSLAKLFERAQRMRDI